MNRYLLLFPAVVCLSAACNLQKSSSPVAPAPLAQSVPAGDVPTNRAYPSNGPDVIAFVTALYPERLAGGVSHEDRVANMSFLRDRIIEVGKCGGMDLGWNLKRGGPDTSIDFIVDRTNGESRGIDIGFDYDNTSEPLRLQWIEGTAPFYKEYPETSCS